MDEDRKDLTTAVSEIVRRALKENTGPDVEIRPELSLVEDLNLDSLTLVDVVLDMEDQFKIKIAETDMQQVSTVGDLTELVSRKQQAAAVA
jgi:acyl carrier protein